MPMIIPALAAFLMNAGLVAAGSSWAAALAMATTIVTSIATAALGMAVSFIGKIIAGKADAAGMGSRIQLSRGAAEARRRIYGTIRSGGVMIAGDSKGTDNNEFWFVAAYSEGPIHSYLGTYFNDVAVSFASGSDGAATTAPYSSGPRAYSYSTLGTATQAAIPEMVAAWPAYWTSASQCKGVALRAFRVLFNRDVYPNGLPSVSSIVKGALVYDPRLDSTVSGGSGSHRVTDSTTWQYSENVALCLYDYMRHAVVGSGIPNSEFNVASIIACANVCDEAVTQKAGGTRARYTMAGEVYSTEDPSAVIERFEHAMAGKIAYSAGEFHFFAGKYDSPVHSYDDSSIISVEFMVGATTDDTFNAVQGLYLAVSEDYQAVDYPKITNATYVSDDAGYETVLRHDIPFCNNGETAQRLAKIMLERGRLDGGLVLRTNLSGMRTKVWDTIQVSNTALGWTNKLFKVHTWRFVPPEMAAPGTTSTGLTIEMHCTEEASSLYSWNAATDATTITTGAAPNVWTGWGIDLNLPGGSIVFPVTSIGDLGGTIPGIQVGFDAPSDLTLYTEIQYKAHADTTYLPLQNVPAGSLALTVPLPAGTWDVRLRHVSITGAASDWVYVLSTAITDKILSDDVVNINGMAAQVVAAGARIAYRETWDEFLAVADANAVHTYAGTGERTLETSGAVTADKVFQIGNNSGADGGTIYPNAGVPFDPSKLYRVFFRVKRTAGSGTINLGLIGFNGADSTVVDTGGSTTATTAHWVAAAGVTPTLNVWTTYVGYVKGTSGTGSSTAKADPQAPGVMQTNVRNIRWIARANVANGAGTYQIDEVKIEEVNGALSTFDSADTGQIDPNAVTDNTASSHTTATLTVPGTTSVATLSVTAPAGYDILVFFFGKFTGTGFGDKTWLNSTVVRTGDSVTVSPTAGLPTLWNRTDGMGFITAFMDPAIAVANPTYRLDIEAQEASWSGSASNLKAAVLVVKR